MPNASKTLPTIQGTFLWLRHQTSQHTTSFFRIEAFGHEEAIARLPKARIQVARERA